MRTLRTASAYAAPAPPKSAFANAAPPHTCTAAPLHKNGANTASKISPRTKSRRCLRPRDKRRRQNSHRTPRGLTTSNHRCLLRLRHRPRSPARKPRSEE
ncbi:hypothetical protein KSP39_PZI023016 [Platanthera zijinensis]|uniref:Uncharacterized protein n=1 Tax=Platanthera zijinensis TaxID=2320716 RepID=A0AAP0AV69_9ASPA